MSLNKIHSFDNPNAPVDTYNFIYFLIFFLGLSGNLPWNAILTAQPYFNARLADSSIGGEFTAHFTIIFKSLKLAVFSAVSVAGLKMNNKLLVGASAVGNVLVFSILSAMVHEEGKTGGGLTSDSFYLITLALVIAASSFLAIFECGMYSILGTFPSHLTQSFMAGNAIGGILAALNLIISYYSAESDIYSSTKTYFIISTIVFIISVISFSAFLCTDYCKFYQKRLALYTIISQVNPQTTKAKVTESESVEIAEEKSHPFEPARRKPQDKPYSYFSQFFAESSTELIRKMWSSNVALFFVGFVNLTIFPALVSVTESTEANKSSASAFQKDLFVPVAFLVVSIADFLGKMMLTIESLRNIEKNIPFTTLSISRLLFIPLMLLGNIRIKGKSLLFPSLLASDTIFFIILTAAFLSGAYLGTLIMITAPKKLDITQQSRATVLLCSAGLVGVFSGSVSSLCLKLILRAFVKS